MLKTSPLSLMNALKMLPKSEDNSASKTSGRPNGAAMPDANDMKEEIGMMFTGKQERQRNLQLQGQRRKRQREMDKLHMATKAELHQMHGRLTENNPGKRDAQTKQLRDAMSRKPSADTDELLQIADNDPAILNLLLEITERDAREQQNGEGEELHREITKKQQAVQTEYAQEIKAACNTLEAFAEFSPRAEVKQALRNLYYDSIVHQQSEVAMFDLVLEFVQKSNPATHRDAMQLLLSSFKTLNEALSDDVAALAPSISPGALRRIMTGSRDSVRVATVVGESNNMLMRVGNRMPLNDFSALDLTHNLLRICQNGTYEDDLKALGQQCLKTLSPYNLSMFFTNISMLLHKLPHQVWKTEDGYRTTTKLLATFNGQLHKLEKQQALRS